MIPAHLIPAHLISSSACATHRSGNSSAHLNEMVLSTAGPKAQGECTVTLTADVVIHYHHGGDTLPLGTLHDFLAGARWTEADLERLGLF